MLSFLFMVLELLDFTPISLFNKMIISTLFGSSSSLIQVMNPTTLPIAMKLDEDNFLLRKQQIYVVIRD